MNEKYNAYVRSVADYFIEEMKKERHRGVKTGITSCLSVPLLMLLTGVPMRCFADGCQNGVKGTETIVGSRFVRYRSSAGK